MTKSDTPLQRIVRHQLAILGKSAGAASTAGGLGREFIRDILNGRKRSVNSENLPALAKALSLPVEMLAPDRLNTDFLPDDSATLSNSGLQSVNFRRVVPLVGDLKRGAWIMSGGKQMNLDRVITSRDERYSDIEQEAWKLTDNSVSQYYPINAVLITGPAESVGVREGSLLVVRRTRANGEAETSAWQAATINGTLCLTTASDHLGAEVITPITPDGDVVKVEILGVVITAMIDAPGLSGPMINTRLFSSKGS